jgi:hypothetical protein
VSDGPPEQPARIRAMPRAGDRVTVLFLATRTDGVIEHVNDDLHRLRVITEDGERITFALNRATGRFLAEGHHSGARLVFGSENT